MLCLADAIDSNLQDVQTESSRSHIPAAFLRWSHSCQYWGHFMPSVFPAALASFQSLPQARSRAIMASRPGDPVLGGLVAAGAGVEAGADAVAGGGALAAGPSAASPPHSALRNSFHVRPLRVPASLAAW